jgi:hypothetical protein
VRRRRVVVDADNWAIWCCRGLWCLFCVPWSGDALSLRGKLLVENESEAYSWSEMEIR